MTQTQNTRPKAQVFDLGYKSYSGPREGRSRALKALYINGLRTILGIGRGAKAKVFPVLMFVSVAIIALVFILIDIVGVDDVDPNHAGFYQTAGIFLIIFAALTVPELLIPDRRHNVLQLYLVRMLTPLDYLLMRTAAFFSILLGLVYTGQIALFVGALLVADDIGDYLGDNWLDILRFLGAGAGIALLLALLPLFVSAFASRNAYAALVILGYYAVTNIISSTFVALAEGDTGGDAGRDIGNDTILDTSDDSEGTISKTTAAYISLIALQELILLPNGLFFPDASSLVEDTASGVRIAVYAGVVVLPAYLLWRRYKTVRL